MPRLHPFVVGHVVAALVAGLAAGALMNLQAALVAGASLAAGAAVSSIVCRWKPGLDAPAWTLAPVAILANPLMLSALSFMIADADCLMGNRRGWDCIAAALAVLAAGVCLLPPFGGLLWRWWKRRRPAA